MTWVSNKGAITTALTNISYKEIPERLKTNEVGLSHNDKTFSIFLGEPQTENITNDKSIQTDLVMIEINYRLDVSGDYDSAWDLLRTVHDTLKALSGWVSLERMSLERHEGTNKVAKGIIEFYYGIRVS